MFVKMGSPARKNRAFHVKIDNHDVWNLDFTLAHIIHPALVRLKERVPDFGYPTPYHETGAYPEHYSQGSFEEILDRDEESKYYEKLWMDKLQKMIDAFAMIIDEGDDYDKIDEGLNLFAEHYQGLWD